MGKRCVARRSVHDAHRPNGNAARGPAMAMLRKLCATAAHDVRRRSLRSCSRVARADEARAYSTARPRSISPTVDRSIILTLRHVFLYEYIVLGCDAARAQAREGSRVLTRVTGAGRCEHGACGSPAAYELRPRVSLSSEPP